MALIKKLELKTGIILENAYFKIPGVNCTKEFMNFTVDIYKDKESRESGKLQVGSISYECLHDTSENSTNCIRQAYQYLKTLDEYEGGIDDLED